MVAMAVLLEKMETMEPILLECRPYIISINLIILYLKDMELLEEQIVMEVVAEAVVALEEMVVVDLLDLVVVEDMAVMVDMVVWEVEAVVAQ